MKTIAGSTVDLCQRLIVKSAFLIEITTATATRREVSKTRAEDGVIACPLLDHLHGAAVAREMAPKSNVETDAVTDITLATGDQFPAGFI